MTKQQWIDQFKAEYTELYKSVNGERIKLSDEEYEATIEQWADNEVAKAAEEQAKADAEAKKESGKAKLKALGLSDAEIEALVG